MGVRVRERAGLLGSTAVVPSGHPPWASRDDALVEDALEIVCVVVLLGALRSVTLEERGRRKLATVADDDELASACDRTEGVFGRDLARFVEDHDVELQHAGVEKLRDGERAHQEARLQASQCARYALKELSQRRVPAFASYLAL